MSKSSFVKRLIMKKNWECTSIVKYGKAVEVWRNL